MKVRENMKNIKDEIENNNLKEIRKKSKIANIQFNSKAPETQILQTCNRLNLYGDYYTAKKLD